MENRNGKASSRLYVSLALLVTAILAITVITLVNGVARRGESPRAEGSVTSAKSDQVKSTDSNHSTEPNHSTESKDSVEPQPNITPETQTPMMLLPEESEGSEGEESVPDTKVESERTAEVLPTSAELNFVQPTAGYVVKFHDLDTPVYSFTMEDWRCHRGVDISASVGSEVKACAAGVIAGVGNDPMMGETVMIDHGNGLVSIYRNLSPEHPSDIVEGARVEAGQCIGGVGESALVEISDASHLHFEMKLGGIDVDPLDYIRYDLILEE